METVGNILTYFKEELSIQFDQREVAAWAYLSINNVLGFTKSESILRVNDKLTKENKNKFTQIVDQLKSEKPIQYILGETDFYGLQIRVNEDVLIPRPETEELVDWILEYQFKTVLDIGTGSGCISIALAKKTNTKIFAIDVSKKALKIAEQNRKLNEVDVSLLQQDIFKTTTFPMIDIIISNPPYIPEREKGLMNKNVLSYEPHLALFVPDRDPLVFYKKIGQIATKSLNSNGKLFFEIHEKYAYQIIHLLSDLGFVNIELKKDINGKDRMIKAVWK